MPKSTSSSAHLLATHLQPIEENNANNPYVRAAAQFSGIRVFWLQSLMTLTKDQWNDVPSVYFERPPQRKSHKKPTDQNVSDPRDCETGTKKRAIFFTLLFLGQQKIPDDCDLVGEPGDVWVTEGAVQVRTIAGWTDWKTRWTHDGGLSHPYLPADYKLTFQAALPSLGYNPARYPKTYQDWLRLTPDRLRECFDHYLGPDEAPLAAERALSLLALPSGKELKPYLEICGGGHHNNLVRSSRSVASSNASNHGVEQRDLGVQAPAIPAPANPYSLPQSPASTSAAQSTAEGSTRSITPIASPQPTAVNRAMPSDIVQLTSASAAGPSRTHSSQTTPQGATSELARSRSRTPPHDEMMETTFDDFREASPVPVLGSSAIRSQAVPLSADPVAQRILECVENLQSRMSVLEERLARYQSYDHRAARPTPGATSSENPLEDAHHSLASSSTVAPVGCADIPDASQTPGLTEARESLWSWIRGDWLG